MKEDKVDRYTSPRHRSAQVALVVCVAGRNGAAKSSWGWQMMLTSEVLVAQFLLPKGDEVTGRCFSVLTELHAVFCKGPGSSW